LENEIKLRVEDARRARCLLAAAGFHARGRRLFEDNTVYDTSSNRLRRRGELLRVRRYGGVVTVTFKGSARAAQHKLREELEVTASDFEMFDQILRRIGFQPTFRYEKFRTEFAPARGDGLAMLDETPIGVFVELEGPARWINASAVKLGFTRAQYIIASYGGLYLQHCREGGVTPGNMVFTERPPRMSCP
jgi:adenylate cyclase class 2